MPRFRRVFISLALQLSFLLVFISPTLIIPVQTASASNINTLPATGTITGTNFQLENLNESELLKNLIDFGGKAVIYIFFVVLYWLLLKFILWSGRKVIKNDIIYRLVRVASSVIFVVASVVTILFAFVGNLSFLATSFGVLSAALVVALQDFVSSFFAWLMIKVKSQFRVNDIIQLNSNKGTFTGKVVELGFFRTSLKEKIGGNGLDKEFYTGKIISFPNNLILKEGAVNYTLDNKLLWHDIHVTITFESDYEKASLILKEISNQQFEYALDHKDTLLDDVFNLKSLYKPQLYMNIGSDGVEFTVWFACRVGLYRESLEEYSRLIMHKFKLADIHLAYRTSRIISTPGSSSQVGHGR